MKETKTLPSNDYILDPDKNIYLSNVGTVKEYS